MELEVGGPAAEEAVEVAGPVVAERQGRALRQRKPVNYNVKSMESNGSNTPSWLKSTSVHQEAAKENKKPGKKRGRPPKKAAKVEEPVAKEEVKPEVAEAAKSLLAVAPTRPKGFKLSEAKKKTSAKPAPKRRKKDTAEPKKKRGRPPKKAVPLKTPDPAPVAVIPDDDLTVSEVETPDLARFCKRPASSRPTAPSTTTRRLEALYDAAEADLPLRNPRAAKGLSGEILDNLCGGRGESSVLRDLLDQYNEMKMKYQELKSSRMSHVQSMLEEQSKNILKQQEASDKLVKHWKQEAYKQADMVNLAVEEAVKEAHDKLVYLGNKRNGLERECGELRDEVRRLAEENEQLRGGAGSSAGAAATFGGPLLSLLTGLDVLEHSNKAETYRISHARTGFSFELDCSNLANEAAESSDIGYVPVSFGTLDSKLPEYLKEEIYFDRSQVPILLEKILATVKVS